MSRRVRGFDAPESIAAILPHVDRLAFKAQAQVTAEGLSEAIRRVSEARPAILSDKLRPDRLDHTDQVSDAMGICG